jgi:hypothetical protein
MIVGRNRVQAAVWEVFLALEKEAYKVGVKINGSKIQYSRRWAEHGFWR